MRDYEGEVLTAEGDFSWDGVRLQTEPGNQATKLIELSGGRLQTPFSWVQRLDLKEGVLAVSSEGLEVVSSSWSGREIERLELSGLFHGEQKALLGSFEGLEMSVLLPEKWLDVVGGRLFGEVDWSQGAGGNQEVLKGRLAIEDGVLQSFPFLDRLAAYAGTARMKRLSFEKAMVNFRKEGERLMIEDLVLFDEGLLCVEGELLVEGRALSGQLQVGVPPGLLAHIPGAEEKVFLPGKQGLRWAPVQISGTWERPREDLSERMIRAAGERMFELIPETGQWALRYTDEALDQGTALLLEGQEFMLEEGGQAVQEVIEQGSGVVEEGVKTGFGILNGLNGILGGEEE